ncbi:MAG: hypothetical protein HY349_06475 [Nitrospirae bacterium]|nr:hypothetical protein [Nitrospirota bacterium]
MLASVYKNKYSSFKRVNEESEDFSYEEHDTTNENRLQDFVAKIIAEVSGVEYIYCRREGQVNYIWAIINELDPQVRRAVYKKEMAIIDLFPEMDFDFNIIARMNKPIQSIISQDGIELIYKKSN